MMASLEESTIEASWEAALLGPLAFGNVAEHAVGEDNPILNMRADSAVMRPDPAAIPALYPIFDAEDVIALEEGPKSLLYTFQICGVDAAKPQFSATLAKLLRRVAEHLFHVGAHVGGASGLLGGPSHIRKIAQ